MSVSFDSRAKLTVIEQKPETSTYILPILFLPLHLITLPKLNQNYTKKPVTIVVRLCPGLPIKTKTVFVNENADGINWLVVFCCSCC